jgi:hypothetical protein
MAAFRRRLASGALVLTALQFVLLFAPMSCCVPFRLTSSFRRTTSAKASVVTKAEADQAAAVEECPLHKSKGLGSKSEAQDSPFGRPCAASHGPQFLLGAIGVLSTPGSTDVEPVSSALPAIVPFIITARPALPDAPPPRLL